MNRRLLAALMIVTMPAWAVDIAELKEKDTAEQFIAVGRYGVPLAPGSWQVHKTAVSKITRTDATTVPAYQATLMQVQGGMLRALVNVSATEDSLRNAGWSDDPCAGKGKLFRKDLDGNLHFPECVTITPEPHMAGDFLRVDYTRLGRIGMAHVSYWINPISVGFPAAGAADLDASVWNPAHLDDAHRAYIQKLSDWAVQMATRTHDALTTASDGITMLDDFPQRD